MYDKEKLTVYSVVYSSFDCCDNYHHVESNIFFAEEEARKEYKNYINAIKEDFEEHDCDTSWLHSYEFPKFISAFCNGNETSYVVRVEKK